MRITDPVPQDLKPTTDPDNLSAATFRQRKNSLCQASFLQITKIAEHIFTPRQNQGIRCRQIIYMSNHPQADIRLDIECIKIREIGDVRHINNGDVNLFARGRDMPERIILE